MTNSSISSSPQASNSWNNPRKRPYSYDPTTQLETTIDEDILRHADTPNDLHSSKRLRVKEWPLKNSDDASDSPPVPQPAHRRSMSPHLKRNSGSSIRSSRFVEGSMNDKVSQQPPSLYTHQEQAMEQYASANMEDVDMVYDAGIQSNKPSTMFRFGKAIASAFNSVSVWPGLNGIWKEREKESQAIPERDALKAKAERKYAELKKSGYQGTQTATARPECQDVPEIKYQDIDDSRPSSFRDSGVDVDEYRSSSDVKDTDQFIASTDSLMPPSVPKAGRRSASPFSDASSGRRSSIRFHKPSLEGLKKVKSQVHLPSIKRHAEEAPSLPSTETDQAAGPGLRREASKKDIAKQYKLVKKVSDLENKLETARRELEMSIQQAPPVPDLPVHIGRKRFVPGALPSLPSERLLTPHTHKTDDAANPSIVPSSNSVDVFSAPASIDDKGGNAAEPKPKAEDESAEAAKQAMWNKRSSDIAARNAAARNAAARQSKVLKTDAKTDDVLESEAARRSVSTRNGGRSRKSLEHKVSSSHEYSTVQKRPLKVYLKGPRKSPMTDKDEVPPVPVKRITFDPTTVDQASIMAMRAIPDNHLPFGKAWDDMKNLRKEYPIATEVELEAYMNSQLAPKKFTDHRSVSHSGGPSSPSFLGPPGSTTLMKTRARASRRGISPPPPSLSSAKKFHRNLDAEKTPPVTAPSSPSVVTPEAHPVATKRSKESAEAARASLDKPLPDIRPDDFEWDDDVF